jgi:hypothetical protein
VTTRKSNSGRSEAMQIEKNRTEQLAKIQDIIILLEPRLSKVAGSQRNQLKLLESVSLGLYSEIDKLSKKAPAELVTDLVLSQMNEVIKDTKELVIDDPYVQRLQAFVAAGDNPQHRDAVVMMRQVRQGLDRFKQQLDPLINKLENLLSDARCIEKALQLYLKGNSSISRGELKEYGVAVSSSWITDDLLAIFDFRKLDRIDLVAYFELSNE